MLIIGTLLIIAAIAGVGFAIDGWTQAHDDEEAYDIGFHHGRTRRAPDWPYVATLSADGSRNYFAGRRAGWNAQVADLIDRRTVTRTTTKGDAA